VLSVLPFTDSDYPFGICKTISIYCLLLPFCPTYDYLQSISIEDFVDNPLFPLSVPFTDSDYPFGIFKLFLIDIVKITKDHISISVFIVFGLTRLGT
jgi:hypothetical protein